MSDKGFKARVVEILLDKYIVQKIEELSVESSLTTSNTYVAMLRGNVKKRADQVLVGDIVTVKNSYDTWIIESVEPRKNSLIRPPVANIDQLILLLSISNPSPDYILLDKQLAFSASKNIKPVICLNKIDLINENNELQKEVEYIKKVYSKLGIPILFTSVKDDVDISKLKEILDGKISVFSGNSGVGKSSITESIMKDIDNKHNIEIGELTTKLNKGKHTTKYVRLYIINNENQTFMLDTPGFSSYELYDIEHKDLKKYYPEFKNCTCRYLDCMHVNESEEECEVKSRVAGGKIDKNRYDRYVYIFSKLKEKYDRKYK